MRRCADAPMRRCADAPMRRCAGGREICDFPKKFAILSSPAKGEIILGTLHYGRILCAVGTMGYKHRAVDHAAVLSVMPSPNFLLKIIPHADGSPRTAELVRVYLQDIQIKGAWTDPEFVS
jgi:acetoacetate decarboxylase